MKKILLLIAFVLFSSVAFAQTDKIILVSDVTSADMLIGKAASEKTGIPMLVLENGMLSDDIKAQLSNLSVKTVILIGGPAVIKPETGVELQNSGYTVVRLWGDERTGTSLEVAKYFWPEGTACAVIVDDSKDSDADTQIQSAASEAASNGNCPLFPVPKGKAPAEVLDILKTLNTTNVEFIGFSSSAELKLLKLQLKEITGNIHEIQKEVEREIENKTNDTLKLVIIASTHWRDVLGTGGNPERHTIIRIVSNTSSIQELLDLIKTKNITDIRVVGNPLLADQIASLLQAQNITVEKVSGEKSDEVARKLLMKSLKHWEERRRNATINETSHREIIKQRLYALLNDTQDKLNQLELELAQLNASGADPERVALIQSRIDAAQSQISAIMSYIDNGNFDTARIRMNTIINSVMELRWVHRAELKVDSLQDLRDEENDIDETQHGSDLLDIESKLAELKSRCNSTSIENIIQKARSLKQAITDATASGNFLNASQLSIELRELVKQARSLKDVCEKHGKITRTLENMADQRAEKVQNILQRFRNSDEGHD